MAKAIKASTVRRDYFKEAVHIYEGTKKIQPKKKHIQAVMDKLLMLTVKTEKLGVAIQRAQLRKQLADAARTKMKQPEAQHEVKNES